ncbi:MAG: hypothetical protein M1337_05620 [Actinobacteria bacterium]|jgi:hypothetical protein|nr:hypothetical protein [Actinomycetota bacterium]
MSNEAAAVANNERFLRIDGRRFDAIGFAVDRDNLQEMRKLCSKLKLSAPWRAALRDWSRGSEEFLVMFADASDYDEGVPSVIFADSAREFEISIHCAVSGVLGRKFYWGTCLEKSHQDQLCLALYADTNLAGNC